MSGDLQENCGGCGAVLQIESEMSYSVACFRPSPVSWTAKCTGCGFTGPIRATRDDAIHCYQLCFVREHNRK